jgi:hypothetical protein
MKVASRVVFVGLLVQHRFVCQTHLNIVHVCSEKLLLLPIEPNGGVNGKLI